MPIISQVRRGSWNLRLQVFLIYLVLTLGAVTMVYPFMVMISGSFKSEVDSVDYDVIPRYFYDESMLFSKYEQARYYEDLVLFNSCTGQGLDTFRDIKPPTNPKTKLVEEWRAFLGSEKLPVYYWQLGQQYSLTGKFMPLMQRRYMDFAAKEFKGDLDAYNRSFNSTVIAWFYAAPTRERFIDKRYIAAPGVPNDFFLRFKQQQEPWHRIYQSVQDIYRFNFLSLKYGSDIKDYNGLHGTNYKSYREIILPQRVPAGGMERADWLEFVRVNLNLVFVNIAPEAIGDYRAMIRGKYNNDSKVLDDAYDGAVTSFDQLQFPTNKSIVAPSVVDMDLFVKKGDPKYLSITGPDFLFRKSLQAKYGSIEKLNRSLGTSYTSFATVDAPVFESDWATNQAHGWDIRKEFMVRNYSMVINYVLLHGRGVFNTFMFCLLAVVVALTVNPIAAYAMSRYALPSTYKILLFMMATTAFPAVVTMIPNFLLLKQLGLLNTFWALFLPGVASGYSIFLLKGFFDSLPRELYESASLDGASEWVMFWKITMALSKPILAVLALGAFTGAYGMFMYAFTVCQDQSMWTLMVWLYRLQTNAHMAVSYAALLIAAVPTLIVFIASQNVILRGIIVPQEK